VNNVGVNARTVVNEVTSANPSVIQGAINVLGPRANIILANPFGVTIDGGSFVNTGHVVLSTGQVSFADTTDQGAGVRSLGKLYASAGDAIVSANGDILVADGSTKAEHDIHLATSGAVSLQGAQVSAAHDVTVNANGIAVSDDATGSSTLSANHAIALISTADITNTDSLIQAGSVAQDGTLVLATGNWNY
jgi:filamentous hemagglutinin family protein